MTSLTDQVLNLVAGVLRTDAPVTADSELKQAGLSSLSATRLWFALRKEFGVDIPVTKLGQCGTVREIAAEVARGQAAQGGEALPRRRGLRRLAGRIGRAVPAHRVAAVLSCG